MLNEIGISQIYSSCGFDHAIIKKQVAPKGKSTPNANSLKIVLTCIKIHKKITRLGILKKISISEPTLMNCLFYLLETGEIERLFDKCSGPHSQRLYRAVKVKQVNFGLTGFE